MASFLVEILRNLPPYLLCATLIVIGKVAGYRNGADREWCQKWFAITVSIVPVFRSFFKNCSLHIMAHFIVFVNMNLPE